MESSVYSRAEVESLGRAILKLQPNAIVRLRLLRDVLRQPAESNALENTQRAVASHPWVKELVREQHTDGTWGRFHSMDSTIKTRFPTTEIAVRRALALGLNQDTPILKRAVDFMQSVLEGKAAWSDRVEKSESWPMAVQAITAATLAEVDPAHPGTLSAWEYWVRIASLSFPGGSYDPDAEWNAHKEQGSVGICYLGSRYVLTLLSSRSAQLPASLDHNIVDWVINNPAGVGYLGANLRRPDPFHIFHWLESLEIMSCFQSWRLVAGEARLWLKEHCSQNGLWDFGTKVSKSPYFPLSDDWRKKGNRSVDHSTRILAWLSRYDPGV
jgi:hypothetical protein